MSTSTTFYGSIFPASGVRVLVVFKNGLKSAPVQEFFMADADLIASANVHNAKGRNVYHACAVFNQATNRLASNVGAAKTLWADLDAGVGKAYPDKRSAVISMLGFVAALGLPQPHIVLSGNGAHFYLPFTAPISADNWTKLASMFQACMDHYGVKHDSSRTTDIASILRVPGTSNFKDPANPKAVTLQRVGVDTPAKDLAKLLKAYIETHGLVVDAPKGKPSKTAATNDIIGNSQEPTAKAPLIEMRCRTIKDVAATGGDVDYNVWWRSIGIAKFCENTEQVAAHWTRNRAATGHDKYDYEKVLADWAVGPTTCNEFSKHSDKCITCPHRGSITSPIQLDFPVSDVDQVVDAVVVSEEEPEEQELAESEEPQTAQPVAPIAQASQTPLPNPNKWTFRAPWIINKVRTKLQVDVANGKLVVQERDPEGGFTGKHLPLCDRYWQLMRRVRRPDNTWALLIAYDEYAGAAHSEFEIESAIVTSPELLRKAFSSRELHILGGQKGMIKTQDVLQYHQALQFESELETRAADSMGWQTAIAAAPESELIDEFVLGNTVFRKKCPPEPATLTSRVPARMAAGFETKGTTAEWVRLINGVYDRHGAELYQFIICAAFAAPLVRMAPEMGQWYGMPIVLNGGTGSAKTTMSLVACTIYGPPSTVAFNSGDAGSNGDTVNAFAAKVAALRNLPFIADEMSNKTPAELSNVMYMLANGRGKDRATTSGALADTQMRWSTISFISANESFHESMREIRNNHKRTASQIRSFQIDMSKDELVRVFGTGMNDIVNGEIIQGQYGCVGRDWIQALVNNRAAVRKMLIDTNKSRSLGTKFEAEKRFYHYLLVDVEVAARIAKKMGLITWDVDRMMKWARGRAKEITSGLVESVSDNTVADLLASLYGRTIVTRKYSTAPGRPTGILEESAVPISTSEKYAARKATEDRVFVISADYIAAWARKEGMTPQSVINELDVLGYIKKSSPGKPPKKRMLSLTRGTILDGSRRECYELDYDLLDHTREVGSVAPLQPKGANVIPLNQPAAVAAAAAAFSGLVAPAVAEAEEITGTSP